MQQLTHSNSLLTLSLILSPSFPSGKVCCTPQAHVHQQITRHLQNTFLISHQTHIMILILPQSLFPVSSKIFTFYHIDVTLNWVNKGASIYLFIFLSPKKSWSYPYKYKRHIQQNRSLKRELNTCDKWSGGRLRKGDYCKKNSNLKQEHSFHFYKRKHKFLKKNNNLPELIYLSHWQDQEYHQSLPKYLVIFQELYYFI